jgi:hypothetical protein
MFKTVSGTFKGGAIVLNERTTDLQDGPVLVTFLESCSDAAKPPLTREQAAEVRARLAAWEADWNAPGMEVYDEL